MNNFLLTRLSRTLLTLFGVVTLTFALGRLSGDPLALMLPETATMDDYARMRESLGLDGPLPVQYVAYLGNLAQGDLGTSIFYNRPAVEVVLDRIPATLQLGIPAFILSILVGIPLGILVAYRRDGFIDRSVMSFTLAAQSLPSFLVAILLILLFSVQLELLPSMGRDTASHFILPTLTLAIYPLAFVVRLTRSAMLETLTAPYVQTARAKGLRPARVTFVHALRNALIPVITVVGLQAAAILSGAAIVETVFAWPGIGALAVESVARRDYPVIQTTVLVSAAAFAIANTLVDYVYTLLDPQIKLQAER